jgi:hypothetical protein
MFTSFNLLTVEIETPSNNQPVEFCNLRVIEPARVSLLRFRHLPSTN